MKLLHIIADSGSVLEYVKKLATKLPMEVENYYIFSEDLKNKIINNDLFEYEINKKNFYFIDIKKNRNIFDNINIIKKISNIIKEVEPFCVYINGSRISYVSRIACLLNKDIKIMFNPSSWSFADINKKNKEKWNIFFERYFAKKTDIIINISDYEIELAKKNGITPKYKLVKINDGIDFKKYQLLQLNENKKEIRKEIREKLNIDDFQKAVALVGKINEKKNVLNFLKANLELIKMGYNIKIVLIGEGEQEEIDKVLRFAEENNILDKIEITGWVDNLPEYLYSMDVGVLIPVRENSALSAVEFMASCVPVVAVSKDSIPEFLDYGNLGKLVQDDDPYEIAQKIQQTIIEINENKINLESIYREAYNKYNVVKFVNDHINLLNDLM